ncbi:Necrosis inducing protein [Penicillium griseofulvum]|uniref:Necrosis inducing protein n=1 Tax=Penicillium patulum TaxID=5078 RepID=A0A135LHR8_PENPA|nr:Necrosis inducing protein [Penicillium griseofulvum]KXG48512.1 Necrosis inducing protein [Penicillium griseofulvum]
MIPRLIAGLTALAVLPVTASPVELSRRGTVGSDDIVGLPQTVPAGATGGLYLAYQPDLHVVNGCVPFPGVDANGNTNAGLKPTGKPSGDCDKSTGQIYVRGASSGDRYALMYSWYFPKDSPSTDLGHRHDWEGVIVWLSNAANTNAANILAVCPSAHGGWECSTDGYTLDGTAPLIKYESIWPVNHACGLTTTVGGRQPLVAWESMSKVVQNALDTTDFGSGNVPFNEANFAKNLANATF